MTYLARIITMLSLVAVLLLGALPTTAAPGSHLFTVRVSATPDEAARLIREGYDLAEAREDKDVFALVDQAGLARLRAAGWDVRIVETGGSHGAIPATGFPPGYRTLAEIEEQLHAWNAIYPDLMDLVDYGDSWERSQDPAAGHDLWAVQLRTADEPAFRPVFFLLATIHARELAPTEVALRWVEELLEGYGQDPAITTLLQTREIWVVPLANPDGRVQAEAGILWRKNTNHLSAPCPDSPTSFRHAGVDLNRNSSWQWGTVDTPLLPFCSPTYPGPAPHSEPEVEALEALIGRLFVPRDNDTDAAGCSSRRQDTPGLFITLHSYGNLVLYPWGHTAEPACQAEPLARLAKRFAAINGYQPNQAINLYPTSGTTDDWAYGALGIASFTFEIGPASGTCGGFFPAHACVDHFYSDNRAALTLAAFVANDPYQFERRVFIPFFQ